MNPLQEVKALFSSESGIIKNIIGIVQLEAKLARLSIVPLLINLVILFITGLGLWFIFMIVTGYLVAFFSGNVLIGILTVLGIHIVLVVLFLRWLSYNVKNMSFNKTRQIFSKNRAFNYEKLEKENHSRD